MKPKGMPAAQHVENDMEIFSSKNENEGGRVALPTEGGFPNHTITTKGSSGNTAAFFSSATHIGESQKKAGYRSGEEGPRRFLFFWNRQKGLKLVSIRRMKMLMAVRRTFSMEVMAGSGRIWVHLNSTPKILV